MDNSDKKYEQSIEDFVKKEIYICQTTLVEEALKKHIFQPDEITNLYRPFDGKLLSPAICVKCRSSLPFLDSQTGECEGCFEKKQTPQEILEWWVVSSWLARKLLLESEPVLINAYGTWWGRCISGQTIAMDDVIRTIYDDIIGR